jgi:hypothetical protein
MAIQSSWLIRGYFDLSGEDPHRTTTQEIRDALSTALRRQLRIAMYPVGPNWKHTFWWREGAVDYAEAQFFMRIDENCPILSVGVSVEKGREGAAAEIAPASERMDRSNWDWQRLIQHRLDVLQTDVPETARRVERTVNLRIRAHHGGQLSRAESLTFSFADGQWFQRHHGTADVATIASRLEALDQRTDRWVDLYFATDLDPSTVEGMTAADMAGLLVRFQPIRERLQR